ncbi:MAG: gamma-glutamyltransferase [Gemmatimonadaceae bacterium]|nr:gamma-glutamyltransferase [Gemmatimonadaceae bacterium]
MSWLALLGAALLQGPATVLQPAMRDPAYAPDGRLAVSIDGDLWLQRAPGEGSAWRRLTSGEAWDREPTWTPDGRSIVFTSDRAGGLDLWRIDVGDDAPGAAVRLTTDDADDMEATVARDGTIVFTRGRGSRARLWLRDPAGAERRVTKGESAERWGAFSPDGTRLAYVQLAESARRLRVRALVESGPDSIVVGDRGAEQPVWSPDGERLAFSAASPRGGVYVAPRDGRYVNLVALVEGRAAWSPDGRVLAIAEREQDEQGYNGDPRRLPDRVAESLGNVSRLRWVAAPVAPDGGTTSAAAPVVAAGEARAARNAEMFDRIWSRLDRLYYSAPSAATRRAAWQRLRDRWRARALAAASDLELERAIHAMLRERPPFRDEAVGRAAVASAHPVATAAGLEILAKGGNVVDAAVATSFALGVVEPDASGMGGYGEMLVFLKGMEKPVLFEFMARVPEEGGLSNAALLQDGRYPSDGPVLAMVPGTVAGMHAAWKRLGSGKVTWRELLAPAIRAAREGYVVSDGLATTLWLEQSRFLKYEGSRALFFRDGKPLAAGDTLRNPDLAWTLEQVAAGGADGFYRGEVARRLVQDLRGKGNAVRLTDLARYFAPEREPVSTTYRGNTIFSSAPPASGGTILAAQLNNLERFAAPAALTEDAASLHAAIAAWQLAPSGRGRIADPSLWPVNTEPFTSKDTAAIRWRCFDPARAVTPALFRGDTLSCGAAPAPEALGKPAGTPPAKPLGTPQDTSLGTAVDTPLGTASAQPAEPSSPPGRNDCAELDHAEGSSCRPQGTTAFTVGDAEGNLVAVTQTLGTWGGNFYVTPGLGFLYNDKLTSYGTDPNQYGARLPYARHGSTLAPTIAFRGSGAARRPWFAVGAAGNAWINAAVYQAVVGMVDLSLGPQRALEQPRFLPGQRLGAAGREMVIDIEDGFAPDVIATLRGMGYHFDVVSLKGELRMGYGSAVMLDAGRIRGGGDPRRAGVAGALDETGRRP